MIDESIYALFYQDYTRGHSFLHSHTHSANALAVSAALAVLNTIEKENINQKAADLGELMHYEMEKISAATQKLNNIRSFGAIVAADLEEIPGERISFKLYQEALKHGALLRPIGNTLYWLPPLNCDKQTIVKLAKITLNSIKTSYQ